MKLIFAGTPGFAATALDALLASSHNVVGVLTQPDRPAGRGMKLQASEVKQLAAQNGIEVLQPPTLKPADAQEALKSLVAKTNAEVLIVAAYGLILPQAVLDMFQRGAINIHASLLPRWRGAAPIQRALLAGDAETGVCIMQMDAGLDTGPVLLREGFAITGEDDTQSLHDRLASVGGRLIVQALDQLERGELPAQPQPAEGSTYARKIDKAEARIDWTKSALEIDRQVRAFRPAPGAVTTLEGKEVKLWRVRVADEKRRGEPGAVLSAGGDVIRVATGGGVIDILELQQAGGKRIAVANFLAGHALANGTKFTAAGELK